MEGRMSGIRDWGEGRRDAWFYVSLQAGWKSQTTPVDVSLTQGIIEVAYSLNISSFSSSSYFSLLFFLLPLNHSYPLAVHSLSASLSLYLCFCSPCGSHFLPLPGGWTQHWPRALYLTLACTKTHAHEHTYTHTHTRTNMETPASTWTHRYTHRHACTHILTHFHTQNLNFHRLACE